MAERAHDMGELGRRARLIRRPRTPSLPRTTSKVARTEHCTSTLAERRITGRGRRAISRRLTSSFSTSMAGSARVSGAASSCRQRSIGPSPASPRNGRAAVAAVEGSAPSGEPLFAGRRICNANARRCRAATAAEPPRDPPCSASAKRWISPSRPLSRRRTSCKRPMRRSRISTPTKSSKLRNARSRTSGAPSWLNSMPEAQIANPNRASMPPRMRGRCPALNSTVAIGILAGCGDHDHAAASLRVRARKRARSKGLSRRHAQELAVLRAEARTRANGAAPIIGMAAVATLA